MKIKNGLQILCLSVLTGAAMVSADEGAAPRKHPCHAIKAACKAAGFERGDHKEGKGLFSDCMRPILEGKAVAGVTVKAEDVQGCKTFEANHKGHREGKE